MSFEQKREYQNGLGLLFGMYISECKYSKGLREHTLKTYTDVFTTFQKIVPEVISCTDLNQEILHLFFFRISTRRRIIGKNTPVSGVKPSTIKTYFNKLMAFFKWLENNDYLKKGTFSSMSYKPPNPEYTDTKALDNNAISKIISSITMHNLNDSFTYRRDLLIFSLLIYTGIRRRELIHIHISDIDIEKGTLKINGKTSKGKRTRFIPLHSLLLLQIKSFLNSRREKGIISPMLIISVRTQQPLTVHGLKHWVERYRKLSGVHFHLHQMRHSFACSLAKVNTDVISIMKVMGHSTIKMTQNYLRSIAAEDSREYIERLSF